MCGCASANTGVLEPERVTRKREQLEGKEKKHKIQPQNTD